MSELSEMLKAGNVLVTFTKHDDTERIMKCTTIPEIVSSLIVSTEAKPEVPGLYRVVDIELNEFRSFYNDKVISYQAI